MTTLSKPVLRKVSVGSSFLRRDPIVLTLHPGGFIGVREAGRRAQYKINLKDVVRMAVLHTTSKIIVRQRELRKNGLSLRLARRGARNENLQVVEQ